MSQIDKINHILSVPNSALICVIFGIMLLSFPIGAYVVFNSNVGNDINFQYPLYGLNLFFGGISYKLPLSFEVGDGFIIAWSVYLILFSISFFGPKDNLLSSLSHAMSNVRNEMRENALLNSISWFSILIFISVIIDFIQETIGVRIESPESQNYLIHFFQLSVAPLTEEIGFRVILIGIPLFLMFSYRASLKVFFKSLWKPSAYLTITNYKKPIALIVAVGLFFGVAHIISGTPWSAGKFTQAAVGGIIIGWVYFRYGFAPAVLIHWASNFFISSYLYFISDISQVPISSELSNPFSSTLEELLVVAGIIVLTIKILNYLKKKRESATIPQI